MSASKCGSFFIIKNASSLRGHSGIDGQGMPFNNCRLFRTLNKIRRKYPNFEPRTELEIWLKARALRIIEEE